MKTIFKCVHGSRLYGTDHEKSDWDYKEVFVMSLSELITGADDCYRDKSENDSEFFSVKKFAMLLGQQQTNAIEMLFTPEQFIVETSSAWEQLWANRSLLVSKNILPFVAYAKAQAKLYSEKGNSLNMLKAVQEDLVAWCSRNEVSDTQAIEYTESSLNLLALYSEYPQLISKGEKTSNNGGIIPYLQLLNKQFECFAPITEWKSRIQRMIDTYGERAKSAAASGAFDRKAMYHAVRIVDEAVELLETGALVFPRPSNILTSLLTIRFDPTFGFENAQGLLLERYNHLMDVSLPASKLREAIDKDFLPKWVLSTQTNHLRKELVLTK